MIYDAVKEVRSRHTAQRQTQINLTKIQPTRKKRKLIFPMMVFSLMDHLLRLQTTQSLKNLQSILLLSQDSVHKVIELTDAMDMEAPGLESVSKPVDAPEPRLPQESELKQPQADNKNFENSGKIAESLSSTKNHTRLFSNNDICTYCNKIIDGNAKIVFNEPAVICHPKCLKCGVCATNLGGLEIPMFLSNEAILCVDCYRKA
ncbi:hypothetical protein OJAV_G00138730 [Oryzias javanicus]|uniref:LIM zinc-binding domain-containing protein n=1 Tax=Oryzias javanicus TaxID=123683 RepID=A0A437CLN2_ORYJA|nr:hypothetical protein OJAV_G00138730 [Oryzias javanicus]